MIERCCTYSHSAEAAGVRAHRHAELRREQQHREHLVDAAEPARVDLAVVDRLGLQQLLEHDAVRRVLTGRDADRRDRAPDRGVAEHVVGARRLLDPPQAERLEVPHPLDRLPDVPHLVGVGHQRQVADLLAHHLAAPDVGRDVDADLRLEAPPAVGERGAAQVAHLRPRGSRASRPT